MTTMQEGGATMPLVTKDRALELLSQQIQEKFGIDELIEVYNEVFPEAPCTEGEAHEDSQPLIQGLVKHVSSGLEMDEVVDLWGLIFPKHRDVWYDEEEERLHYTEAVETVSSE